MLSFAGGVVSCFWITLAVWLRSLRRERRLARVLEQVEARLTESRNNELAAEPGTLALPAPYGTSGRPLVSELEEFGRDEDSGITSVALSLPRGYDDDDQDDPIDPIFAESEEQEEPDGGRSGQE